MTSTSTSATAMTGGRRAGSARRRQRVITAVSRAVTDGTEISVSAIARAALLTELCLEFQQFSG